MSCIKTIGIISDIHAGHYASICPPSWWYKVEGDRRDEWLKIRKKRRKNQEEMWYAYKKIVTPGVDVLFVLGDAIDGTGQKHNWQNELITSDRIEQIEIATRVINEWKAKKVIMVYGTPTHTGETEDWEKLIQERIPNSYIASSIFCKIEGLKFHAKHHAASSSSPQGINTALTREVVWNLIRQDTQDEPRADILLRGHTHRFTYIDSFGKIGISCPALQLPLGKSSRLFGGWTDWGCLTMAVHNKEVVSFNKHICKLQASRPKLIKI